MEDQGNAAAVLHETLQEGDPNAEEAEEGRSQTLPAVYYQTESVSPDLSGLPQQVMWQAKNKDIFL
jgi:hypothetical protein